MDLFHDNVRGRLEGLLHAWLETDLPSRWALEKTFQEIIDWRDAAGIPGLFEPPPLLLASTLDDGWGHGLQVIQWCATAAGLQVHFLGLLQDPEKIVSECHSRLPDLLGLTMLHSDSEPALTFIRDNLPSCTQLIVGGPPFRLDPELGRRTRVHFVAGNVRDFLGFILSLRAESFPLEHSPR